MKPNAKLTLRAADEMSYCREALRELSEHDPVMVKSLTVRKQHENS